MGRLMEGWGVVEDNLGKMVKNCMKITKSKFLDQNNGDCVGHWEEKPIFR